MSGVYYMISSRKDLNEYLKSDKAALGRNAKRPGYTDLIWKFEICMRKLEYYTNCPTVLGGAFLRIYKLKYFIYSILCGFSIPINVFGKGLSIAHRGTIVVNGKARIGENCRIHACVNIGTVPGVNGVAPTIGDNVYIGPGAKIYGNISVASGIMIGANAVVNKSFDEENICIAGAPARKISDMGRFEIEERNSKEFK